LKVFNLPSLIACIAYFEPSWNFKALFDACVVPDDKLPITIHCNPASTAFQPRGSVQLFAYDKKVLG